MLGKLEPSRLPDFLRSKHNVPLPVTGDRLARSCEELARHLVELRRESA
jgi:hypothetical protein